MNKDLQELIKAGESSNVQFKERIIDKYDSACEIVAFCNSHGGKLLVGIRDKTGEINPLSYFEVQVTTNLLSAIASENVVPSILIEIETVSVNGGSLIVVTVKEGPNKPYHDNKGIVWVKNGADKRKVFGKYPQRWLPVMTAKCICFAGNDLGGKVFRDKINDADMEGNLLHQYRMIMDFFTRNLRNIQVKPEFNSPGKLEIPYSSLIEFTVNSLVHRSLNIKAPIRIFIFDNRVEIHSPGALPNGLTIDDIKAGTSLPRNMFLFSNAIYLLPYTGIGSGITRALNEMANVSFTNNTSAQEFVVTFSRDEVQDLDTDLVTDLDTKKRDLVTKLSYLDTDLDTKKTDLDTKSGVLDTGINAKKTKASVKNNQLGSKKRDLVTKVADLVTQKQDLVTKLSYLNADLDTKEAEVLAKQQKDLLNFCSVPRTAAEIMKRLGISNQTKNRERYITSLVTAGYLRMTNPENPKASNQKYQRTEKK